MKIKPQEERATVKIQENKEIFKSWKNEKWQEYTATMHTKPCTAHNAVQK